MLFPDCVYLYENKQYHIYIQAPHYHQTIFTEYDLLHNKMIVSSPNCVHTDQQKPIHKKNTHTQKHLNKIPSSLFAHNLVAFPHTCIKQQTYKQTNTTLLSSYSTFSLLFSLFLFSSTTIYPFFLIPFFFLLFVYSRNHLLLSFSFHSFVVERTLHTHSHVAVAALFSDLLFIRLTLTSHTTHTYTHPSFFSSSSRS